MPITRVVMTTAKVVVASYRILFTLVLGYYLITDTIRKERYGRALHPDRRGPRPK